MTNNNGRPLSRKQTVRLMIALTILAWATQTLMKQWGHGAELSATSPAAAVAEASDLDQPQPVEKFVPGDTAAASGATLELRGDATVVGGEVKLKQVCRWSDRDKPVLSPVGELIIAHLAPGAPFKSISVEEIRGILRDAGINIAAINFAGATSCTVARSDVQYDQNDALQQWIDARQQTSPQAATQATQSPGAPAQAQAMAAPTTAPAAEDSPLKTLRAALTADLATRLNLAPEVLQVDFRQQDEKVLNISQPLFKFQFEPVLARSLGRVMWKVSISGGDDAKVQKVMISGDARAWQNQVLAARPLAFRQVIRAEDLVDRRTLVDQLSDDPLLSREQIIGQQASREIKPGMLFTGRMIDPVQLVKTGQFVTVTLDQGSVRIRTVARALESGSYGQTVRVKNEVTKDVFQVVLTGPQTATMNLAQPLATAGSPN